jgi:hypothetical protein
LVVIPASDMAHAPANTSAKPATIASRRELFRFMANLLKQADSGLPTFLHLSCLRDSAAEVLAAQSEAPVGESARLRLSCGAEARNGG